MFTVIFSCENETVSMKYGFLGRHTFKAEDTYIIMFTSAFYLQMCCVFSGKPCFEVPFLYICTHTYFMYTVIYICILNTVLLIRLYQLTTMKKL